MQKFLIAIFVLATVAVASSKSYSYYKGNRVVDENDLTDKPGYHRRQLHQVIFFQHDQFRGTKATYKGFGCINLLKYHQDSASSVFLRDGCIHLFDGESCSGEYVTLYKSEASLTPMQFNDKVSSISAC